MRILSVFLFLAGLVPTGQALAHGMSEGDKAKLLEAGAWGFVEMGAGHMLTGYDHLLFLLGVVFFLTRFGEIVKFITAFTVGHSITLIFATLYGVRADHFLIDAVIALTVCYKGFDNLGGFQKYLGSSAPNLLWMVFIFGWIHGFGLSTRLQQLPLPEDGLVLRILAFNLGVEVGQVLALSAMLVLLAGWRKTRSFAKFSSAANAGLVFLGFLLFLTQLHGYHHTKYSDEYPMNIDAHHHLHEGPEKLVEKAEPVPEPVKKPKPHVHKDGSHHSH